MSELARHLVREAHLAGERAGVAHVLCDRVRVGRLMIVRDVGDARGSVRRMDELTWSDTDDLSPVSESHSADALLVGVVAVSRRPVHIERTVDALERQNGGQAETAAHLGTRWTQQRWMVQIGERVRAFQRYVARSDYLDVAAVHVKARQRVHDKRSCR